MKFTAIVRIGGKTAEITYENGKLSGSPDAVRRVECLALSLEGTAVGPVPAVTFTEHLKNPLSAKIIIEMAFNGQVRFSGNVPRVPRTPKGAVN
ncbi:hypothetical protein [Paenibacillus naphthalenovorans]|uniref:hypothetical protein n=1 Tax=Paenibacillus naphthalenovorans TaxID=162209 RepID=UPI003D2D7FBB